MPNLVLCGCCKSVLKFICKLHINFKCNGGSDYKYLGCESTVGIKTSLYSGISQSQSNRINYKSYNES